VRQEIISNEETQEHKVIDNALKVVIERQFKVFLLKFQLEILSDHCNLHKLEFHHVLESGLVFRIVSGTLVNFVTTLSTLTADHLIGVLEDLSQDVEVRLMGSETKHDQISVSSVNAVAGHGVVVFLGPLGADEIEDFMLSFSGYEGI